MLSDGTKWAPETCQAEHYWVWTASRCCGECGGLLLWSLVPGHRDCAPPGSGLSGGRLQLVQEVVQGWDAFLQAFALACLRHYLTGAAGVVKGVTGRICQWSNTHWGKAWPPVLDLRSAVKPAEGANSAQWETQYVPHGPLAKTRNTDSHQRIPEVMLEVNPVTLHFTQRFPPTRATD